MSDKPLYLQSECSHFKSLSGQRLAYPHFFYLSLKDSGTGFKSEVTSSV
jgi:hypothetical protein